METHSAWANKAHESLRIFDSRKHKVRKSKIPVPTLKFSNTKNKASNLKQIVDPSVGPIETASAISPICRIPAATSDLKSQESFTMYKPKYLKHSGPKTTNPTEENNCTRGCSKKAKKTVKLRGLELTSLPMDIFRSVDLESLFLSPERESCLNYKLPYVPKEIGNLISLQTLVLDTNELQSIPCEISNLKHLEALTLSNNCLTDLPEGFSNLDNLRSLHLANNRFYGIPLVVCHLPKLGFLDMCDNDLSEVPEEIGMLAQSLHTLLLFMNKIEELPSSFTTLTCLTCLWLGENCLKQLPRDFGELFRLDWGNRPCSSNISGNPLVRPPMDICQLGTYAIRKFFHDEI